MYHLHVFFCSDYNFLHPLFVQFGMKSTTVWESAFYLLIYYCIVNMTTEFGKLQLMEVIYLFISLNKITSKRSTDYE